MGKLKVKSQSYSSIALCLISSRARILNCGPQTPHFCGVWKTHCPVETHPACRRTFGMWGSWGCFFSSMHILWILTSVEYHFNLEPGFYITLFPPICLRMVNGGMIFEKSLFTWQGSRCGNKTLGYYHGNVDKLFWFCLSVASSRVSTSAIFHGWVRSLPSWTKRLSLPLPWLQRGNLWFGSWFFHMG